MNGMQKLEGASALEKMTHLSRGTIVKLAKDGMIPSYCVPRKHLPSTQKAKADNRYFFDVDLVSGILGDSGDFEPARLPQQYKPTLLASRFDVAEEYGISPAAIDKAMQNGEIPFFACGNDLMAFDPMDQGVIGWCNVQPKTGFVRPQNRDASGYKKSASQKHAETVPLRKVISSAAPNDETMPSDGSVPGGDLAPGDGAAPKGDAAPSDETAPSSDTVPTDGFDDQTAMGDDRKDAIVERMIEAVGIIIANHGISKPQEERKRMAGELVSEVIKAVIATGQVVVPPIPAPTTVLRLPLVAELTGCGVRSLQTMGSAGKLKIVWKDGEQCVELREFDKVWDVNFATTDNLEHLLGGDEAAAILNISTQELYNLVRYHKKHPKSAGLPSHKGRHTRRVYLASELKAYMKRDPHRYRHALTGKARSEKLKVFRSLGREQVGNSQKEDDQHD